MLGRDEPRTFARELARAARRPSIVPLSERASPTDDIERDGYDLLLECTGSDEVMLHGCGAGPLVRRDRLAGQLARSQPAMHNVQRLMREGLLRNHIHLGCVNAAPRDFHDALAHLGQLATDRRAGLLALITARVRPADSLWHYEHRQPQGIKTVLMYAS